MSARPGTCWAGDQEAAYRLDGAEVAAGPAAACEAHAGSTLRSFFSTGASAVIVTLLDDKRQRKPGKKGYPSVDEVIEQVRRCGAQSADPERLRDMEAELWAAVLAAIAEGAPGARDLATAALMTLRYGHDRRRS